MGEKGRLGLHGEFWALDDVNFEVGKGERVGIVGRNGAGKSTLLKLLSRVTSPTKGRISVKGRIASLLEVGTGFHPELTGRENIFLNGAILGMKRREIQRKFDEIVAFSGVDEFIDTPVKRYSSGMHVRLAFSVASHLDSEILIIDEVLAVGDAAFQKRSIEKMQRMGIEDGRTILFVSHQTPYLLKLCNKGVLLDSGKVVTSGDINDVVATYQKTTNSEVARRSWTNPGDALPYSEILVPMNFEIQDEHGEVTTELVGTSKYYVHISANILRSDPRIGFAVQFYDHTQSPLFDTDLYDSFPADQVETLVGVKHFRVEVPTHLFFSRKYSVELISYLHWTGAILPPNNQTRVEFSYVRTDQANWYAGDTRLSNLFIPLRWEISEFTKPK